MEKRFFIALALSFLLISVYSGMQKKSQPVENKEDNYIGIPAPEEGLETIDRESVAPRTVSATTPSAPLQGAAFFADRIFTDDAAETTTYETDELAITISRVGGYIKTVTLKEPFSVMSFRGFGAVRGWTDVPFEMLRTDEGFVLAYQPPSGEEVIKRFVVESPMSLSFSVQFNDVTDLQASNYDILVGAVSAKDPKDPMGMRYLELAYYSDAVARRPLAGLRKSLVESEDLGWLGLRDKYFAQVVVPGEPGLEGFRTASTGDYRLVWAPVDSLKSASARVYFGPQDEKALRHFEDGAHQIVSYGKFDIIAKPVSLLLHWIQGFTKNWGVAIILMTIIVYTLLSPLSLKSMKSMRRMQSLQPQVEALKAKMKDNPQKMHAEVMDLYKREHVNPMGGCLPMLLQIPVFFSLYQVLMRSISLKGQGFLWIKDLSLPDRLFVFKGVGELPFIGNEFNLLPILMAGLMVLQQKITMKNAATSSPEMAQQQKIMGTVMPLVFGVLFYKIQSGLVLYWFTNSLLSVVFQWKVNKSESASK